MPSLPSYINTQLNLEPPPAMDHVDSEADSDDEDSDRYELVTFRIPIDVKLSDLNGINVDLSKLSGSGMPVHDGKLVLQQGDSNENETFRVLVPDSKNSKDSDDDSSNSDEDGDQNDSKFLLHPSQKPFARHFNLTKNILVKKSETELAPSVGPEPVGCTLKHSYSHIPQRKGLKRRWMPLGNKQGAIAISPELISMKPQTTPTLSEDDDDDDEDVHEPKAKSLKKRRRSNSTNTNPNDADSPKKKKRSRSKDPSVKQEKEKKSEKKAKKAKKSKKQKKEEDAISV